MEKERLQALQVTKEIVVKFIEIGRISPNNFADYFGPVYYEVLRTITGSGEGVARPTGGDEPERA